MRLDLQENKELEETLSSLYRDYSLTVDKIMNENQRQWGSPEALLIVIPIIAMNQKLDKLIDLLSPKTCCKAKEEKHEEPKKPDYLSAIFVKPEMRYKDVVKALPEGVTIKQLITEGKIKKVRPFVVAKV